MRIRLLSLLLCVLIGMSACTAAPLPTREASLIPETTRSPATTSPPHTDLFDPQLPLETVLRYFSEVCLDAEYSTGPGDTTLVQKWDVPIICYVNGDPTPEDLAVLERLAQWLDQVEGFPGFRLTQDPNEANVQIYFCPQARIPDYLGDDFYGVDGGVTYWYEDNRMYAATVCYSTDTDQTLRNSVILEEIYNMLGPAQDTDLRPDSIIFSGFSQPQWLTPEDQLILRLLYHPTMAPGMDREGAASVIEQLYH